MEGTAQRKLLSMRQMLQTSTGINDLATIGCDNTASSSSIARHATICSAPERYFLARPVAPADRAHASLADAPGGPLPARIPRHARAGRFLPGPGKESRLRDRSHLAAFGAFPARCRDLVLRHTDRARRHGPGPVFRRWRRSE